MRLRLFTKASAQIASQLLIHAYVMQNVAPPRYRSGSLPPIRRTGVLHNVCACQHCSARLARAHCVRLSDTSHNSCLCEICPNSALLRLANFASSAHIVRNKFFILAEVLMFSVLNTTKI